jgi:hypothetical protein
MPPVHKIDPPAEKISKSGEVHGRRKPPVVIMTIRERWGGLGIRL